MVLRWHRLGVVVRGIWLHVRIVHLRWVLLMLIVLPASQRTSISIGLTVKVLSGRECSRRVCAVGDVWPSG